MAFLFGKPSHYKRNTKKEQIHEDPSNTQQAKQFPPVPQTSNQSLNNNTFQTMNQSAQGSHQVNENSQKFLHSTNYNGPPMSQMSASYNNTSSTYNNTSQPYNTTQEPPSNLYQSAHCSSSEYIQYQTTPMPTQDQSNSQYEQQRVIQDTWNLQQCFSSQPIESTINPLLQTEYVVNPLQSQLVQTCSTIPQESGIHQPYSSQQEIDVAKSGKLNTSRVLILKKDNLEFDLVEDDEKIAENKQVFFDEVNNLKIIHEKQPDFPDYQFSERLCSNHGQGIISICKEKECIKNAKQMMCPKCMREHKNHDFLHMEEVLNFIEIELKQNSLGQQMIDKIEMSLAKEFKLIKSKVLQDLNDIEILMQEAFNSLRGQLQTKVRQCETQFANISEGGLSKLIESASRIFDQNQNIIDIGDFEKKIKSYEGLIALYKSKEETIQIKCDNQMIKINKEKIKNLDALAEQIDIALLLQHKKLQIDKDYLLINENKAIKLKGNNNSIQEQQLLEIISIDRIS